MSSSMLIPNASNNLYGTLGLLVGNAGSNKNLVSQLSEQSSTGLVSQTYSGLGAQASISLNLNPQLSAITAYSSNISTVATTLATTNGVLGQIEQIASTFASNTISMVGQTAQEVTTYASQASADLAQIQGLLNTKVGDTYIFAGQDSSNQPVPNANWSSYIQSIQDAVTNNIGTSGAATIAATMSAATAGSPFSSTLVGSARQTVTVGYQQTLSVGVVAGTNTYGPSTETDSSGNSITTGSYILDLVRQLATVSAMTPTNAANSTTFGAVVQDLQTNLNNNVLDINKEIGGIGAQQQQLTSDQTTLTDTQTSLTSQISAVQNVDAAATATALTQAQTQLEISYKLIASMQNMSLVTYITA